MDLLILFNVADHRLRDEFQDATVPASCSTWPKVNVDLKGTFDNARVERNAKVLVEKALKELG